MGRILVVFTGGTIGSKVESGVIGLREDKEYPLLKAYEEEFPKKEQFEIREPFRILSENAKPSYMIKLANALKEESPETYDGVIVTHGTDTLPYTAAFLGYAFHDIKIPLLLVSSNYALGEKGSNGYENFKAAVDFIREGKYAGVFVPYKNSGCEEVSVFLPTRLQEADCFFDDFSSYDGGRLGYVKDGHFVFEDNAYNPEASHFLIEKIEKKEAFTWETLMDVDSASVMKLSPYPGFAYDTVQIPEHVQAIYHGVYHSGTTCVEGEKEDIKGFIARAKQRNVEFFFGPLKQKDSQYATVVPVCEAGGIPVYDCVDIAIYAKLVFLCSIGTKNKKEAMSRSIYHEILER